MALNGTLPTPDTFQRVADLPLIAADGAANTLLGHDILPEYVVGDLDSISNDVLHSLHRVSEIVVNPSQEYTDFEKTLLFAEEQLWTHLLIVGFHGGDLEHTLNNWSVLLRHAQRLHLTVLDRERYLIPIFHNIHVGLSQHELVSLIPQPAARITTTGLEWELNNEELRLGEREGSRNQLTDTHMSITLHEGSFLLACDARMPFMPIFNNQP